MTVAALDVPRLILTEFTLSFLGFSIQPPDPSWGTMLASGRAYIETYRHRLMGGGDAGDGHFPDRLVFQPLRRLVAGGKRPSTALALAEADQRSQGRGCWRLVSGRVIHQRHPPVIPALPRKGNPLRHAWSKSATR